MSLSKDLYRRLPYCIRKHLSRTQSFCLVVTILIVGFVFVFYEAIFIGVQTDDPFDEKFIFQKDFQTAKKNHIKMKSPPEMKVLSTSTEKGPPLVRRRPVVAKMFGVPSAFLTRYSPDGQNRFRCIKTGSVIPFDWVNDDFCDCPEDGSDEPSTNACRKGTFHCAEKHTSADAVKVFPSSRVNDGICDCCDGSDEWKGLKVLPPINKELQIKIEKYHPPCPNVCS